MSRLCVQLPCLLALVAAGCARKMYDPDMATLAYPAELHEPQSIDVQVFRSGATLEIVNSTPVTYPDCSVWINQRFVAYAGDIPAGETVRLSLWKFWDALGDRFSAGGFWRVERPMPIRLVQLQVSDEEPLIGLMTIPRSEER